MFLRWAKAERISDEAAGAERAECHLVLGSCLWMQGLGLSKHEVPVGTHGRQF